MSASIKQNGSGHVLADDKLNPFYHRLHLTFWNKVQIAIMSVTIAPIRLILIVLLLVMVWPLTAISVAFRSPKDREKPLSGWRLMLRPIILGLCRGVFLAGGFFWVKSKGQQATAKEAPLLLLAPHSSFLDALPVVYVGLTSVVAKASTQGIAIFGSIINFSQPVYVAREDPNSRVNTIKEIQKRGRSGGKWPQITIFPEGTCTNRSAIISFKQGAFYPGVPVQPVCIRYPNSLDTATWTWDGPGALYLLWLTLCQFYMKIELEYLPVYNPSEKEKADPKLFADNVRKYVADHMKLPMTDQTYDDGRVMAAAVKLPAPHLPGLRQMEACHASLGLNLTQLKERLLNSKVSRVNFTEFCELLKLDESDMLQKIFDLYQHSEKGCIDFREYIIGLSLIEEPSDNEGTIKLSFELYDTEKNGYISENSLRLILSSVFNIAESDIDNFLKDAEIEKDSQVSLENFKANALKKPQYARVYVPYEQLKKQHEVSQSDTTKKFDAKQSVKTDHQSSNVDKKLQ